MAGKPSHKELERRLEELQRLVQEEGLDLSEEIAQLKRKIAARPEAKSPQPKSNPAWEIVKLARHPKRPSTLDYLRTICDDVFELRGDRLYGDDQAMVTALVRLNGRSMVAIGHQKGHSAEENQSRNFGMPHPEGYRKALRAMELAERFQLPIICFIDTPGAYPGIGAEERHIGGALAENIYEMFRLEVPIVVAVIGEGGSGGALGIGVGDHVIMMENAIYSVISPEGCAAILWRDRAMAPEAARALKLTASDLKGLNIIDEIVEEPEGGAHRDAHAAAELLKEAIIRALKPLEKLAPEKRIEERYQKYAAMGLYEELPVVEAASAGKEEPA